jgi:hypothetical protein
LIDRLNIHAYADGELGPDEMARLEAEIAASPEASRELEAIRCLQSCLHAKMPQPQPGDSWKACLDRLDELDRVKKAETFVGKYAWALCALLFVVILGGGLLNRYRGGSVNMSTVASDLSGMVPMSSIPQPDKLRSWIGSQIGQAPPISSIPPHVVDVAYSDQPEGRIVRVRFQDAQGIVALLIIPNVGGVNGVQPIGDGMFAGQVNGHNCVIRPDSGCAVLVIGDRDLNQLQAFTQSLYR